MKKTKSIPLGNILKNFITDEKKEKELIKALEIGEQSGFIENFNPKQHLKFLHQSITKN